MDVHPTKNVSIGIDPYPHDWVILDKGFYVGIHIFQHHGELIWEMFPSIYCTMEVS